MKMTVRVLKVFVFLTSFRNYGVLYKNFRVHVSTFKNTFKHVQFFFHNIILKLTLTLSFSCVLYFIVLYCIVSIIFFCFKFYPENYYVSENDLQISKRVVSPREGSDPYKKIRNPIKAGPAKKMYTQNWKNFQFQGDLGLV
jgi:hypothetical protein